MSTSIFILLVVQIILIILNAIFASAEIAVLSMNETKLERMAEQGNGRAKRLVRLTQEPARRSSRRVSSQPYRVSSLSPDF